MIVKQIKYYDEDNKQFLNNPADITADKLVNGEYFNTIVCNEIKIKAYPGTLLVINGEEVIVGEVGVYDILYRENVEITSLTVNKESMEFIKNTPLAYLIITFIQDDAEVSSTSNTSGNTEEDSSGDIPNDEEDATERKEEIPPDNHDNRITKK